MIVELQPEIVNLGTVVHDCVKTMWMLIRKKQNWLCDEKESLRCREKEAYRDSGEVNGADSKISTGCDFITGWNLCRKEVYGKRYEN